MAMRKLLLLLKPFDIYPVWRSEGLSRLKTPLESQVLRYLENRLKVHKDAIKFCQDVLRDKPVEWEPIFRNDLSRPISDVDLIVTVGGDGTLLQASHFIDDSIPVIGVNSDPTQVDEVKEFSNEFDATRSTGYLCAATINNFEQVLDSIIEGRRVPSQLSRMLMRLNSKQLPTYGLNDILIAHPCPASVSRFSFKLKGNDQSFSRIVHCRSSGLRVSTAAGSTAAMLSAGGFPMPILSRDLQYLVREPISAETSSLLHGLVKSDQSMGLTWFCKEGVIYIDGSHVCYSVKNGDTVEVSSKAPILKVFLPDHLLQHTTGKGS
ncbi:NADH kinase [Morus notabilis]|uniref:NADH kinase n=1 Tax=Morus notabilis TaxID=981085 RepID=UPI000CECE88F|nr:NADH kinase [Morus notabilis]